MNMEKKEKIKQAENKFGLIILDYSLREKLKIFSRLTGIEDFKILSYWSRSIIDSDFSLEHPDYLEYKKHYGVGDVDWLEKGKTYVDMKKYKKVSN